MCAADEQIRGALKYIRERYGHLAQARAWYAPGGLIFAPAADEPVMRDDLPGNDG